MSGRFNMWTFIKAVLLSVWLYAIAIAVLVGIGSGSVLSRAVGKKDQDGLTAMEVARRKGNEEIIRLFDAM